MKRMVVAGALLAVLAGCNKSDGANGTAAASGSVAAVKPPAGSDWLTTVSRTPEGGYRMGNPDAGVKLVEYGSLTCPHCAEFSEKGSAPLKQLVATGKVSWEYRNYVRDPIDVTASLLVRCAPPQAFFPMVEQLYADQKNWFARIEGQQAQLATIQTLPPAEQFKRIATAAGFDQFVQQRGVSAEQANACLSDQAATQKLVDMQQAANQMNLPGTPTFLINGQIVPNAATWEALEPALKRAGA